METIINSYGSERADGYDEHSIYDKGNREQHYHILLSLLKYYNIRNNYFCDLGCGTGFFTKAFFEYSDESKGVAIDASEEMLQVAKKKLASYENDIQYICDYFQNIKWNNYHSHFDIIFSSLAIHHLNDVEKQEFFLNISRSLKPDGIFILYDLFKFSDPEQSRLLEYLACSDIQRRIMTKLEIDWEVEELSIKNIIENDRASKNADGDQESTLDSLMTSLSKAGFKSITTLFQDIRIVGLLCSN